jgi:hypothetical protein
MIHLSSLSGGLMKREQLMRDSSNTCAEKIILSAKNTKQSGINYLIPDYPKPESFTGEKK